ncbi:hypothetical protein [Paenibacillus terrae]|nr:hypothetical protein [Paenibacillus terrae]
MEVLQRLDSVRFLGKWSHFGPIFIVDIWGNMSEQEKEVEHANVVRE